MKITTIQVIVGAIVTTLFLFVVSTIWMEDFLSPPTDPTQRLEYLKFTLEVYKAIGLGFLITILGVAIPNILPEARYGFEIMKEERAIYSKVQTGIIYLPYKLAHLNFTDALAHLENLQFQKHIAETYPQPAYKAEWLHNQAYNEIRTIFSKLTKQTDWDSLSREERLKVLLTKDEPELYE